MADRTKIEWSDATWTAIRARNKVTGKVGWHCEHATPGCEFCYSEGMNRRLGTGLPFKPGHRADIEIFLDEDMLLQPLRWKRPRMIFVCSMTDLFADFVPNEWIDRLFAVMALCPQHTFQVLTKRSARMRSYCNDPNTRERIDKVMDEIAPAHWHTRELEDLGGWPLPNVWLGVSAEDQRRADERVPDLLATPAAVRFVSAEPLLGPLDLRSIDLDGHGEIDALRPFSPAEIWASDWDPAITGTTLDEAIEGFVDWGFDYPPSNTRPQGIDWVIVGGESGPNARPMHPSWARSIRDQCAAAGVPFFLKQMSGSKGRPIKDIAAFPEDLQIREMPHAG